MQDNVLDFPSKKIEIYGCSCDSVEFNLLMNGIIQCPSCNSVVPLMVVPFPGFVKNILQKDVPEEE